MSLCNNGTVLQGFTRGEFDTLFIPYTSFLAMLLLNRKDQKLDAAGDFDDEPEVLESVEVWLLVTCLGDQ